MFPQVRPAHVHITRPIEMRRSTFFLLQYKTWLKSPWRLCTQCFLHNRPLHILIFYLFSRYYCVKWRERVAGGARLEIACQERFSSRQRATQRACRHCLQLCGGGSTRCSGDAGAVAMLGAARSHVACRPRRRAF